MKTPIKTLAYKDCTIKIYPDEHADSPRDEGDTFDKMICFHPRYNLGDKHGYKQSQFGSWSELLIQVIADNGPIICLPLYLYDHSGITMSTDPFNDSWDSGQVGLVFKTEDKAKQWLGIELLEPAHIEIIKAQMRESVAVYDQYLRGDIYTYTTTDDYSDDEEIDSGCNYFGLDETIHAAQFGVDDYRRNKKLETLQV